MKTIVEKFARFFSVIKYEDLPADVVTSTKQQILDFIGVAIGGFSMTFPRIVVDYLGSSGGRKEATLIYSDRQMKVPAMNAAFGNAVCGHSLDMDGGHRLGGGHAGVTVIPAAIAGGEAKDVDGKSLILGVVLGIEIICRIGKAIDPSHLKRGFHRTSTLGPFGAAAAVGKIYGLDEKQLSMALGFAGLQGAGLLEVLNDGAMAKPIQPGKAAMAGVISAELAGKGAKSPASILEGEKGFFKAMADEVKPDELFKDLGEHYHVRDQYVKLHASCRHTHPSIDAVLQLIKSYKIDFDNISTINISTYPVAISFAATPHFPENIEEAKFSIPFSVSLASFYGDAGRDRYCRENIINEKIRKLSSVITIKSDQKWEKLYPHKRGATVKIICKNHKEYCAEVELARGEPENPVAVEDLINKFNNNTREIKYKTSQKLIGMLLTLENHDISDFTKYLVV